MAFIHAASASLGVSWADAAEARARAPIPTMPIQSLRMGSSSSFVQRKIYESEPEDRSVKDAAEDADELRRDQAEEHERQDGLAEDAPGLDERRAAAQARLRDVQV